MNDIRRALLLSPQLAADCGLSYLGELGEIVGMTLASMTLKLVARLMPRQPLTHNPAYLLIGIIEYVRAGWVPVRDGACKEGFLIPSLLLVL